MLNKDNYIDCREYERSSAKAECQRICGSPDISLCTQFSSGPISSSCLRLKKSDSRVVLIGESSDQVQKKDKVAWDLSVLARE